MKVKADLLQAGWSSLIMISVGIDIGRRVSYASEISIVITFIAAFLILFSLSAQMKVMNEATAERIDAFRYRGLYPPKDQGSDDDVKRLKDVGEKGLALRLYLELHAVPLKEAKRAFDAL